MKSTDVLRTPMVPSGQAARVVGVSVDALETLAKRGILEPERSPAGRLLYRPADVEKACAHFAAKSRP